MCAVQMSEQQFTELIETIKSLAPPAAGVEGQQSKGSFSKCPTKFGGQRDHDAVEEFVNAIETYKDLEGISDKDALKGLPLLFYDIAREWWKGVRRDVKTWPAALALLREHFAPTVAPYQIYMQIFEEKQECGVPIDTFVCQKRALLAKLPEGLHDEDTELNFVYGLLAPNFRQQIPRHEIKSFKDLLEKGRNNERSKK